MMKKAIVLFITILSVVATYGQDITGRWNGILKIQDIQLRTVFHFSKNANGYVGTMDSPDQKAKGIPITSVTFTDSKLVVKITNLGVKYNGELKEKKIIGVFKQNGQEIPLTLSRKKQKKKVVKRPQDPVKPYPYSSEEVTFKNLSDSISLSGTLTLPKKGNNFPVVILITGSGPQNRNEEVFNHRPFLIISDYLTKKGIAVLRHDDRGVGKSEGNFKKATSVDFARDVESAIAYLKTRKEINKNKIGLIGHSEGGMIAPMVASKTSDVNFIVLLAGTGLQGNKIITMQKELMSRAMGVPETKIKESTRINNEVMEMMLTINNDEELKESITKLFEKTFKNTDDYKKASPEEKEKLLKSNLKSLLRRIMNPWWRFFLKYDPAITLEKVQCPVLAINGEKDLQVPPVENIKAIKEALHKGGNKNVTTKIYPDLNHFFQECKTGAPNEYAKIEQTFSPLVLQEMSAWILKQVE